MQINSSQPANVEPPNHQDPKIQVLQHQVVAATTLSDTAPATQDPASPNFSEYEPMPLAEPVELAGYENEADYFLEYLLRLINDDEDPQLPVFHPALWKFQRRLQLPRKH